jgi:Family of unknown function (DUF6455)
MWIALFFVSIAAAISFSAAAFVLQPPDQASNAKTLARPGDGGVPVRANEKTVALLQQRMHSLHLDPDPFRRSRPVVFREFLLRCEACESKARCASDLADPGTEQHGKVWREYCLNGAMLDALSTLHDHHRR